MSDLRSEVANLQQSIGANNVDSLRQEVMNLQKQTPSQASVVSDIATGSSKGVAQGLGGPVDILTGAVNALLPDQYKIQNPVGGSSSIINLFNKC